MRKAAEGTDSNRQRKAWKQQLPRKVRHKTAAAAIAAVTEAKAAMGKNGGSDITFL